jgi:hypothetical protein
VGDLGLCSPPGCLLSHQQWVEAPIGWLLVYTRMDSHTHSHMHQYTPGPGELALVTPHKSFQSIQSRRAQRASGRLGLLGLHLRQPFWLHLDERCNCFDFGNTGLRLYKLINTEGGSDHVSRLIQGWWFQRPLGVALISHEWKMTMLDYIYPWLGTWSCCSLHFITHGIQRKTCAGYRNRIVNH